MPMEEQDKRTEEQEDVEGHRRHHQPSASEDAPIEGETDDVEAHRGHFKPNASEGAPKDGGDDGDDFELHRSAHKAL